jgi:hypothetical protein
MVEEYVDDKIDDENSFKSDDLRTIISNSGSYQALNESDIKSIADSNDIPFIDDEEAVMETSSLDGNEGHRNSNGMGCRKTVSFDVINSEKAARMFVNLNDGNDKNLNLNCNSYQCFSDASDAARLRNVMRNILSENQVISNPSYPTNPSCDTFRKTSQKKDDKNVDHSILVDKLKQLKSEQFEMKSSLKPKSSTKLKSYKIRWDESLSEMEKSQDKRTDDVHVCEGKVKALATYYNSLRFLKDDSRCGHQSKSTPNLSCNKNEKLSRDEQKHVLQQLKEWSKFGLKDEADTRLLCSFLKRAQSTPILNLNNEDFGSCKSYKDLLNRIDKIESSTKSFPNITDYVLYDDLVQHSPPDCFILHKKIACNPKCKNIENILINLKTRKPMSVKQRQQKSLCYASNPTLLGSFGEFESHPCRSPCYNTKKQKSIKQLKNQRRRKFESISPLVSSSATTTFPTTKPFLFNNNNAMSGSLT